MAKIYLWVFLKGCIRQFVVTSNLCVEYVIYSVIDSVMLI